MYYFCLAVLGFSSLCAARPAQESSLQTPTFAGLERPFVGFPAKYLPDEFKFMHLA